MEVFVVDAFTERPFGGNPAAVCIVRGEQLSEERMQAIAAEMNLSETAFVGPKSADHSHESGRHFNLRWFTPTCEVPLCGHATLATAACIFNALGNPSNELEFETQKSGVLKATRSGDYITLDFPIATCSPIDASPIQELVKHVIGELPVADVQFSSERAKLLLRLADHVTRSQLEALTPNTASLLQAPNQLPDGEVRGVIVTVEGSEGFDFFSRYFAPWVGIPEDPVTGAAHTVLASYWSRELGGREEMMARQCSPRGGEVRVTVRGGGRVDLAGRACIVLRGQLVNV